MRKKLDEKIRTLITNSQKAQHRGVFVIVGDRAKDQVVNLYQLWQAVRSTSDSPLQKPNVLWCYDNKLGFSSQQEKRRKEIKKRIKQGLYEKDTTNGFENFLSKCEFRFCYYKETQNILGSTYDLLVLQDFEALTPNILCQTIETVRGGGLVFFLLKSMSTLKNIYSMTMNVHERFRTDAFSKVKPLFNERMILSMASNPGIIFLDDELNLLKISQKMDEIEIYKENSSQILIDLKKSQKNHDQLIQSLQQNEQIFNLIKHTKTLDQAKVLLLLLDSIRNTKVQAGNKQETLFVTASRGRGKSAALGLSIAGALLYQSSSIFVSAATPENLKTVFEFIQKGLEFQGLKINLDFELQTDSNETPICLTLYTKLQQKQMLQKQRVIYLRPGQVPQNPDLVVIDEAAAIPIQTLRPMIFQCTCPVFISSTVHGYEGTGRSLSLKLIDQIRKSSQSNQGVKYLRETDMNIPIRYNLNDPIENWLGNLLCLNAAKNLPLENTLPHAKECSLYFINKETLFSFNKSSEKFLEKIWSLFVASHYKNSPNDLQLLSDAPAHCLAVLLGPLDRNKSKSGLPDVLVAIQFCFEGRVSDQTVNQNEQRGLKPSGDLVPWTFSEQYLNKEIFKELGVRVVRIASHKKAQRLGFGTRALQLLEQFFKKENQGLEKFEEFLGVNQIQQDDIQPKKQLKPLLKDPDTIDPPGISYLSVSFGMSRSLFKFWNKNGFKTFYVRQKQNEITGEHSCMMIKSLGKSSLNFNFFFEEYKKRFLGLLKYDFCNVDIGIVMELLDPNLSSKNQTDQEDEDSKIDFTIYFSELDIQRLTAYSQNKIDYYIVKDLIPKMSELFFLNKFPQEARLSYSQALILLSYGLQNTPLEQVSTLLKLQHSQILALYNKAVRRLTKYIKQSIQEEVKKELGFEETLNKKNKSLKMDSEKLIGKISQKGYKKLKKNTLKQ